MAFFGFLAIFPALLAASLIWGLVADPAQITQQLSAITGSLPQDARTMMTSHLQQLAKTPARTLGWGTVAALVVALWSAS